MGAGFDAVKDEILGEFEVSDLREDYDMELMAKMLVFKAEGRTFCVRVSEEFDDDFGTHKVTADLEKLPERLRASSDGKAIVRRSGIY